MPNPKRRHSKTRTAKRRTHDALTASTSSGCPQCKEPKAPHRICPHCGYYKQRQVRPGATDGE
jgi:large subunit ribosomal protein L32